MSAYMNGTTPRTLAMFNITVDEDRQRPHVYELFKEKLFSTLDYRKVDAATSLHRLFRFIEKTVAIFGTLSP